ncbi:MAG: DUF4394 domain-containing protein [Candidatus Sericytochromatia bacterium]
MKNSYKMIFAGFSATALLISGCDRLPNSPVQGGNPAPSVEPSLAPSATPSAAPTAVPSAEPSSAPSSSPSVAPSPSPSASPVPASFHRVHALTSNNRLVSFNSDAPTVLVSSTAVTGLSSDENLVGIDFRSSNKMLYALSNQSKIYTINLTTGALSQVGTAAFTPPINGSHFGIDFNPTVDRIRLHGDKGQDLRLHPDTGAVAATDATLAFTEGDANFGATPAVAGTAYTNPVANATSTQLFAIDAERDVLVKLVNPNDGKLSTVGSLNASTSNEVGFDITADGMAYASLKDGAGSSFYKVNLSDGRATRVSAVGAGDLSLIGIAVEMN